MPDINIYDSISLLESTQAKAYDTFEKFISNPSSEKIFLLEIKLAQELTGWTSVTGFGNTYEISFLNESIILTDNSTENIRKEISNIEENGTALTEQSDIATVNFNVGSYWHDTINSKLYIHSFGSDNPSDYTMIGFFWLYFATKGVILNNTYYEPYIAERGIPKLSQKNLNVHWGVANIGSGAVKLLNGRGYFDQIAKNFIWTNKIVKIIMGGNDLPYSEYKTLFTGKIRDKIFTKQVFILKLKSMAFDLLRSLPINSFWTSNYPNLDGDAEGKSIPYYYGNYNSIQAPKVTCIDIAYITDANSCTANSATDTFTDTAHGLENNERVFIGGTTVPTNIDENEKYFIINKTANTFQVSESEGGSVLDFSDNGTDVTWRYPTYQFKICDHAINNITQVYIDYDDGSGWQTISHQNEDLTNAKFTIIAQGFELGSGRVKVSFGGKHSGGTLIENPPSIAEDILLIYCGYTSNNLLASSFTISKTRTEMELNVPIEKPTKVLSIIERICASDMAFFDEDGDGKLRYRTWQPELGSPPSINEHDILDSSLPQVIDDTVSLYSRVKVGYSKMGVEDGYLYAEEINDESRYKYEKEEILIHDTYIRGVSDATRLAQRLLMVLRDPSPLLKIIMKALQITKTLGNKFKITMTRAPFGISGGYNERPFEIFGISKSFFPLKVTIQARDLPDYASYIGYWSADSTPDYANATEAERETSGFWTDDNGYADPTDENSRHKSRIW